MVVSIKGCTFTKNKGDMICRYENTRYGTVLVITETDKFLGEITLDQFVDCMEERDSFSEDDYQYFYMDSEKLNFCFQPFSAPKGFNEVHKN